MFFFPSGRAQNAKDEVAITIDDTARNPFFSSTKAKSSSAAVTFLIFFLYIFMAVHEEGESGARMCEEEHLVFIFFSS